MDCGELKKELIWSVLVATSAYHFGLDDEFCYLLSDTIIESFNENTRSDPGAVLKERYQGTLDEKLVTLHIDPTNGTIASFNNFEGLEFDTNEQPGLTSLGDRKFVTSYQTKVVEYDTWTNYGGIELPNTRRQRNLKLYAVVEISVVNDEDSSIIVEGWYDVERKKRDGTGYEAVGQTFSLTMTYLPPTPEEEEKRRLEYNTTEVFRLLDLKPDAQTPAVEQKIFSLIESGINPGSLPTAFGKSLSAKLWSATERIALEINKGTKTAATDVLIAHILKSLDPIFLQDVLTHTETSKILDMSRLYDHYTLLGLLVRKTQEEDPADKGGLDSEEHLTKKVRPAAEMIRILIAAGASAAAKATDIVNIPPTALGQIAAGIKPYPEVFEALLAESPAGTVMSVDERDRTAMDYLLLKSNFFTTYCSPIGSNSPEAFAAANLVLQRYRRSYDLLMSYGHDGTRRGCIFYDAPQLQQVCKYSQGPNGGGKFWMVFKTSFNSRSRTYPSPGIRMVPETCG